MQITELAAKNCRVKFWKELLELAFLPDPKKVKIRRYLKDYQDLLILICDSASADNNIVPDELNVRLIDLESKLEQLAESARLESGKSALLNS